MLPDLIIGLEPAKVEPKQRVVELVDPEPYRWKGKLYWRRRRPRNTPGERENRLRFSNANVRGRGLSAEGAALIRQAYIRANPIERVKEDVNVTITPVGLNRSKLFLELSEF